MENLLPQCQGELGAYNEEPLISVLEVEKKKGRYSHPTPPYLIIYINN